MRKRTVSNTDIHLEMAEMEAVPDDYIFFEYIFVMDVDSDNREAILRSLRAAQLNTEQTYSRDRDEIFIRVGATEARMLQEAERIGIQLPLKLNAEGESQGSAAFTVEQRDLFRRAGKSMFRSSKRQEIILSIVQAKHNEGGAEIDVRMLVHRKAVLQFFPLHDEDYVNDLRDRWAGTKRDKKRVYDQPLGEIRDYFGEYVALYFAWLGFYTKMLIAPALFGFIVFIVQVSAGTDNPMVSVYCILLSVWATVFLELWKRRQAELSFLWGTTGIEEEEPPRPAFKGEPKENPLTGELEPFYEAWRRMVKYAIGLPIIGTMLTVVIITTLSILLLRLVLSETDSLGATMGPIVAGVVNGVSIQILDTLYLRVARFLNDWENHRTETNYVDALVAKNFLFQFINSYVSLFYIAFIKDSEPELFSRQDPGCRDGDCLRELTLQLGTIFITRNFVQQAMEVGLPFIITQVKLFLENRNLKKQGLVNEDKKEESELTLEELEAKRPPYEGTFDDYNEMMIQFGYVTLFAAAFPLASLLALINNVVEIRTDALKMCEVYQRPLYRAAEDIGTYYYILEIMSTVAVITNVLILVFTSNQFEDNGWVGQDDLSTKLWIAIIAEHIIMFTKFVIRVLIPDVPTYVTEAIKLQQVNQDKLLKTEAKRKLEAELQASWEAIMQEEDYDYNVFVDRTSWLQTE